MQTKRALRLFSFAAVTASSLGLASEVTVKRTDVPEAVLKAAASRYPKGKMIRFIRETEKGRTSFEIKIDVSGERVELSVAQNGELLVEERTIPESKLPKVIKKGIADSRFRDAKIDRVEQITNFSKLHAGSYEIVVEQGGKKRELTFNRQGKFLTEESSED
jgi:hypothetical protein